MVIGAVFLIPALNWSVFDLVAFLFGLGFPNNIVDSRNAWPAAEPLLALGFYLFCEVVLLLRAALKDVHGGHLGVLGICRLFGSHFEIKLSVLVFYKKNIIRA